MYEDKPVCPWWMIETGWPDWLFGFTKACMDERVLHTTSTDSERQIMLVRLPCWAHQQPTAWPIRNERKLHNNDCSTLPEDSACTTTIHLSWLTLCREFRVVGCSSRQKAYCAPRPQNCMHLLIPSVIYGIVCRVIMQNTAASLR